MKTSQLTIVGTLVVVLGGMGFLYLHDKDKLESFHAAGQIESKQSSVQEKVDRLRKENESLRDKQRIVELEAEIESLKQRLISAQSGGGSSSTSDSKGEYVPASDSERSELDSVKAENERLKVQNQLAREEASLVVAQGAEKKADETALSEYVSTARRVGKLDDANIENHIVIVAPVGQPNFKNGQKLIVRRDGELVLQLTVDSLDSESGMYVTTIDASATQEQVAKMQKGDEIILAPEVAKNEEVAPSLPIVPMDGATELSPAGGVSKGGESAPDLPESF